MKNSYAYALNIPVEVENNKKDVFIPGHISNPNFDTTTNNLYEGLCNDLSFLGFSFRLDDGKNLENGEYRIALYTIEDSFTAIDNSFHFARQDIDGEWSEKTSWTGKVQKIINSSGPTPPTYDNYKINLIASLIIKCY